MTLVTDSVMRKVWIKLPLDCMLMSQIRGMAKTDPVGMVKACRELLVKLSGKKGSPQVLVTSTF
jgi:hypothetical protein